MLRGWRRGQQFVLHGDVDLGLFEQTLGARGLAADQNCALAFLTQRRDVA